MVGANSPAADVDDRRKTSTRVDTKEARMFGVILTVILSVLATVQVLRSHPVPACWLGGGALLVLVATVCVPRALSPVVRVLTPIGRAIGWVNTRLLLGLVFYLVFAPVGLTMRLLRKDLLKTRFGSRQGSYWIPREPKEFRKEDCTRPF